jgi:hypothetical protein
MLRRKNRLMRAGRVAGAGALAARVRTVTTVITQRSSKWLRNIETRENAKHAWAKVREVIRGTCRSGFRQVDGLTAQVLNDHFAPISTDVNYRAPLLKCTAVNRNCFISELEVFRIHDTLKSTATGLDVIPAWFLRLGAPIFAAPLAQLFKQPLAIGAVPSQWKMAIITPIVKELNPTQPSDFRPISVTSVLSRPL